MKNKAFLECGDVVKLKAGSPDMTVERNDEAVHCVWFEGTELKRGVFYIKDLEAVDVVQSES